LGYATNKDYMENKNLVCETIHAYKERTTYIVSVEQIPTTDGTKI
jgi:hypothetical protein